MGKNTPPPVANGGPKKAIPAGTKPKSLDPPQAQHKRSPRQAKQLNRLVESYKLLMAITALCDPARQDPKSDALSTLLAEAQALCMHTITTNRLSSQDQEIAGQTAREHVTLRGYKFRDGTELPPAVFATWISSDRSTRFAVARQHAFRDYETDALQQLRRLEKREYLRRVAGQIIQGKKILEKAAAKAVKAKV